MRRRPPPRLNLGGSLVFLMAFAVFAYSGWNLLQVVGPPIERWLGRPAVARSSLATPTATRATPTPTPVPALPTPTASLGTQRYARVANTDGQGVYLRRTPSLADRLRTWPDDTLLVVLEESIPAEGLVWYRVQDPAGNEGYIPAPYVKPATP